MQFLIIAHDGSDAEALDRRISVREEHLVVARRMKAEGMIILGGAILDDAGRMVGSSCVVEFPDRAALDAWLQGDPYVTGGVWRDIQVLPFRVAPL